MQYDGEGTGGSSDIITELIKATFILLTKIKNIFVSQQQFGINRERIMRVRDSDIAEPQRRH